MTMTTAVTIMARIRVILIIENQNSVSPKTLTAIRLTETMAARKQTSIRPRQASRLIPKVPKKVTKYVPTAVSSDMPIRISTIQ